MNVANPDIELHNVRSEQHGKVKAVEKENQITVREKEKVISMRGRMYLPEFHGLHLGLEIKEKAKKIQVFGHGANILHTLFVKTHGFLMHIGIQQVSHGIQRRQMIHLNMR